MIFYLVRHGKDDDTVRGGWSNHGLSSFGVEQVHELAEEIVAAELKIDCIYSSDIQRAKETAAILSNRTGYQIEFLPGFREVNNGDLAGMKNDLADKKYPGLYWSALAYDECYPNGESPEMFYHRVKSAWSEFKNCRLQKPSKDALLVTHGGVIEVILCIENNIEFSNEKKHFSTPGAELIEVEVKI